MPAAGSCLQPERIAALALPEAASDPSNAGPAIEGPPAAWTPGLEAVPPGMPAVWAWLRAALLAQLGGAAADAVLALAELAAAPAGNRVCHFNAMAFLLKLSAFNA